MRCAACGRTGGRRRRAAGPRGGPGRATWPAGRRAPRRRRPAARARSSAPCPGPAWACTPTTRPASSSSGSVTVTSVCTRAPASLRVRGEQGVELAARGGPGCSPASASSVRPVDLDDLAAAGDAQALVPHPAGRRRGVDAHVVERLDAARGQPVAADLLARERGLLQDDDVETGRAPATRRRWSRRGRRRRRSRRRSGRRSRRRTSVIGTAPPPVVRGELVKSLHKVAGSESRPGVSEANSTPRERSRRQSSRDACARGPARTSSSLVGAKSP